MQKNKSTLTLVASAVILFIGLVSLTYAVNVGNDFDFQSAYRILNASTSSVLGGLSVGTSTAQTPGALYVTGNITSGGSFSGSLSAANVSSGVFGSVAGKGNYTFQAAADTDPVLFVDATNKRVGIGTTSPASKLEMGSGQLALAVGTAAAPSLTFVGDTDTGFNQFTADADTIKIVVAGAVKWNIAGDIIESSVSTVGARINAAAGTASAPNFNYRTDTNTGMFRAAEDTLAFSTGGTEWMRIATSGNVGIGTSTPTALLSVGTLTTGLVAVFGGGSGKIDAGTIDPPYTIGGVRYATYLPAMTGVKEETTGVVALISSTHESNQSNQSYWSYSLDFANAERGSDLWLFYQTTDFGLDWENLAILLTPDFAGDSWYEKDAGNKRIIVYATPRSSVIGHRSSVEVSYRLTAPRFDWNEWPNATENEGGAGFVRDVKE